jgi:ribonuclease D
MSQINEPHRLIESKPALEQLVFDLRDEEWIGFDTEFVGERRFFTTLCLIQIATSQGIFLIDPLLIDDISPVFELLTSRDIIKITHAGENDYRIFYNAFNILPRNVVDTQVAGAFAGYRYPAAFRKLVENELQIFLNKGFTVADWESRPIDKKQLHYAIQDVKYLYPLWMSLFRKLERKGRMGWVMDECEQFTRQEFYDIDPDREAFESSLIKGIPVREQVFLLRLFRWRREEAKRKNISKEMMLPGKTINMLLRAMPGGAEALAQNRRIPTNLLQRHGHAFAAMCDEPPTTSELQALEQIPADVTENTRQDLLIDMLDLLVKLRCLENQIAHDIVLPRSELRKMKTEATYFSEMFRSGWRAEFLGEALCTWLRKRSRLEIDQVDGKMTFGLDEESDI